MKKVLPLLVIVVLTGALAFFMFRSVEVTPQQPAPQAETSATAPDGGTGATGSQGGDVPPQTAAAEEHDQAGADDDALDERSATELYKNAEDAMKAVRAGAADYDDLVLERFTNIGEDCSWCEAFYSEVKTTLSAAETPQEQRSYFAEILAVSGRVENVQALVDAIKNAPNQETQDLLTEALELTVGNTAVTSYLGEQLAATPSDSLRESTVAALTNQGSSQAFDILYQHTIQRGDPDGDYLMGIGVGEMVLEEEAFPRAQEALLKRDKFSHLAVKALLNSGLDGLKVVMTSLSGSADPEADKAMLKEAGNHVSYDEETRAYLTKIVEEQGDPLRVNFAKQMLDNAKTSEETPESPAAPEPAAPGPVE